MTNKALFMVAQFVDEVALKSRSIFPDLVSEQRGQLKFSNHWLQIEVWLLFRPFQIFWFKYVAEENRGNILQIPKAVETSALVIQSEPTGLNKERSIFNQNSQKKLGKDINIM